MRTARNAVIFAVLCLAASPAAAQQVSPGINRDTTASTTFGVKTMTFDLWCQNTQRYAADRCQARRAEDEKAFENYRSAIERYELDYLKQVQRDQEIRQRTNRDPSQTVSGKQDGIP